MAVINIKLLYILYNINMYFLFLPQSIDQLAAVLHLYYFCASGFISAVYVVHYFAYKLNPWHSPVSLPIITTFNYCFGNSFMSYNAANNVISLFYSIFHIPLSFFLSHNNLLQHHTANKCSLITPKSHTRRLLCSVFKSFEIILSFPGLFP